MKLVLYDAENKDRHLDSKFFRSTPELGQGEEFKMNKFLVEITSIPKEGRVIAPV